MEPVSDITDGGWTTETGGTNLYASIDETLPDDADYIRSSDNPVNDTCEVALADAGINPGDELIVEYRYGKEGPATTDIVVKLKQGATVIKMWTHTNVPEIPVTVSQSVTSPELDSITDFSSLSLEITADAA